MRIEEKLMVEEIDLMSDDKVRNQSYGFWINEGKSQLERDGVQKEMEFSVQEGRDGNYRIRELGVEGGYGGRFSWRFGVQRCRNESRVMYFESWIDEKQVKFKDFVSV